MDRRSFLRSSGAAGIAAFADPELRAAQNPNLANSTGAPPNRETVLSSTLAPWVPGTGEWNAHTIGHLYRRAGFGATQAEIAAAAASTPGAVIDTLLDDKWTSDANMPAPPAHSSVWLGVPPSTYGSNTQQEQTDYSYADYAIRRSWAAQMAQPNTMLREKMVYFWANHFVVEAQKVYYPQMLYDYLNYFRKHPWGNFKQMVKDVTILPAMLIYLDGASSHRTVPNENYGRELMELFTLGVTDKDGNPNYTEDDIKWIARALTGYTIDYSPGLVVPAKYNVNDHDNSLKKPFNYLGAPIKPYGLLSALQQPSEQTPDDIIDCLFQYRGDKLAYFICGKLYQYFAYHDITTATAQDIITQLAQTFQSSNWELKPVLSQLLKSEHFFDDANIGAGIKSPFEIMIGLTRHLDVPVNDLMTGTMETFSQALLNQSLLDPPNVKGWPGYRSWVSTTTLPMRNQGYSDALTSNGTIPARGATGYGENHQAITWSDTNVLTWAAQFDGYKSDLVVFINSVYQFLCAMPLMTDTSTLNDETTIVRNALSFPTYEWPGMDDATRTKNIRAIVTTIVSLPEFQLM